MAKTFKKLQKVHSKFSTWYEELSTGMTMLVHYVGLLLVAGFFFMSWVTLTWLSTAGLEAKFFSVSAALLGIGTLVILALAVVLGLITSIALCAPEVNGSYGLNAAQAAPGLVLILCGIPSIWIYSTYNRPALMQPIIVLYRFAVNHLNSVIVACLVLCSGYFLLKNIRKKAKI